MAGFLIYFCIAGLICFTRCYYCLEITKDEDVINAFGPLVHKPYIIYLVLLLLGFVLLPIEVVWDVYELITKKNG